ncbi:imidazolonepropionase [bacterium CPR1]|nr:imidazolonepropionase [bacterium CPR1]
MKTADLIVAAGQIATCAPGNLPRPGTLMDNAGVLRDSAIVIRGDTIQAVGSRREVLNEWNGDILELPNSTVVPGFVDPHTHPLFGGSRLREFLLRSRGASYQEIHASGGGIFSTVRATREASDEELTARAKDVLERMMAHGTTTVEVKSGYGLSTEEEVRELHILRELARTLDMDLVPTFLGAHAIPPEFADRRHAYVDLVIQEMIPACREFARYADIFCEEGAFTLEESRQILTAAREAGLGLRIHAEELTYQGGARMAAELGAASVDHLQNLPESDFAAIKKSGSIPILTPGTTFFLGLERFAPARAMLEADLPVALATDFNAGSCQTESMQAILSLAVLRTRMTPSEALVAATVNAAHSLGLGSTVGSLEVGKKADLLVLDMPDFAELPYRFGGNYVRAVIKSGVAVNTILDSPLGDPL